MPELPEAENIGRALNRALAGRTITAVEVFSPSMRTTLLPLQTAGLPGHRFISVRRRGRYLVADLDDKRGLLMHFGMSGVVRIEPASIPKRKHEHVFIHLDNDMIFRFECTRRFSLLEICTLNPLTCFPCSLDKLGAEPLESSFTPQYLYDHARRRKTPVKVFIMDNSVVVGIGNIYANETLFASRIDPQRPAESLTLDECEQIVNNSRRILHEAIEMGGTTISDFLNVDGSEGKFVQKLLIYGKAGGLCPVCHTPVKKITQSGRSSFYCPCCQH